MEPMHLGELETLEAAYRRDLNCLKDLSRQRRLVALSRLSVLFERQVGASSSSTRDDSPSREHPFLAGDARLYARGQHNTFTAAASAAPYYSRHNLSRFFLSLVFKPCVKLSSEDDSDDCREAAVNLLKCCLKNILSVSHIQGLIRGTSATPPSVPQGHDDTAEPNVDEPGTIPGGDLILTLLNRLQGTPFNEPSEEVRRGLLDILLYILRETACPSASPLTSKPLRYTACQKERNVENPQNGSPCAPRRISAGESAAVRPGLENWRDTTVADKWSAELYAKALIRSVAHALSDTDARNVQVACLLAVVICERLSARTLRKESEPLVSALLTKLRHPQRKTRWHALDALQQLVGASQSPAPLMDKVVQALTAFNYEETTSDNRDKLAEAVVHWFRRIPIRCMKRHVPRLLLLLLSCAADEESEALAERAGRDLCKIAVPFLLQLEAKFSLRGHETQETGRTRHREDRGTAKLDTRTQTRSSAVFSAGPVRDQETYEETEGDTDSGDDDNEDATTEVTTMDDLELLERSWSASASADSAPEENSDLISTAKAYAALSSFLPSPFRTPQGTTSTELFTASRLEEQQQGHQPPGDAAEQQSVSTGSGSHLRTDGEETAADPLRKFFDIARLAYMLRHVAADLVQQALTENSDLVASPNRCCRSLRTLRLLAALLFASPTVTETPHFTVESEELIRLILLHLYKVCHHADALALQHSASVDGAATSRAAAGSSSLVEYAFLVASSQVRMIRKEAAYQNADGDALATSPTAADHTTRCNTLAGNSPDEDSVPPFCGAGSLRHREGLQRNATVILGKKAAASPKGQTLYALEEDTFMEFPASGALKSCLKIVEEAQKCSASIAAVAAPHAWLKPLAAHLLGSDAELVRAYEQRVRADAPQRSVKREDRGKQGGSVRPLPGGSTQSACGRLPNKKENVWHENCGSTDMTSASQESGHCAKFAAAALGPREEIQSGNFARKNELCGRPQYAFLVLGSMLWAIREKRRLSRMRLERLRVTEGSQGDAGENVAPAADPLGRAVAADEYRCGNAGVPGRQDECGFLQSSLWTADEARVCFEVVEQLVYPDGSHWDRGIEGSSISPSDSKPESNGRADVSSSVSEVPRPCASDTKSPLLLGTVSGTVLSRARQPPNEDDCAILLFATSVIPVLVDVCRVLCAAQWGRIFFVLIRLRVEHKASSFLVESALELLCTYSRKAPATLCQHFLSSWVSSEQQLLHQPISFDDGGRLGLSPVTDHHAHKCDDGALCSSKSSSFVDAWSLSDPRRPMLLYILKRLRSISASRVRLDEDSECNTCSSVSLKREQDAQLETTQQPMKRDAHYVTQRQDSRESGEPFSGARVAGPAANLAYDPEMANMPVDQDLGAAESLPVSPHQGDDSGLHSFSKIDHWLPPVLNILARQASPEDVAPLVRVDVLECIFELLENPSTCRHCRPYGRFILESALKPNLQWRPGEANAKLRKAALVCVDSIFTCVTTALGSARCDNLSHVDGQDDSGMRHYDSDTFCDWVLELSPPIPAYVISPATKSPKVKRVSETRAIQVGAPALPRVQKVYETMRVLVTLIESLSPCLLSCLEDDAQPGMRQMTAETLTHFLLQLEACVRLSQQDRSESSGETAFSTDSLSRSTDITCAPERGRRGDNSRPVAARSPTPAAGAPRNAQMAGAFQSSLSSDVGGALLPESEQGGLPRQHAGATGSMQHEFLALCSSLYPALLQRMDDARDTVRVAAAATLCGLLRFLRCVKTDHECHEERRVSWNGEGNGAARGFRDVSQEVQKDTMSRYEGLQMAAFPAAVEDQTHPQCKEGHQEPPRGKNVTTDNGVPGVCLEWKKQQNEGGAPASFKTARWRWSCLDYVVRGVMTFLDDPDEGLAALVHEILCLAGDLDPSLVLQEVQGTEARCIHRKRYEAVREAIQCRSTDLPEV